MIELDDVSMSYPTRRKLTELLLHPFRVRKLEAVSQVSLRISDDESLAVLGENGAGKTTLLKLIGGLLFPTSGRVLVNGFNTTAHNASARALVGYMFPDERSFFWRLTGRENLAFFGCLDNLVGRNRVSRIERVLTDVGLEDAADKTVGEYSSGMKQRLALARALLAQPKILILDEPTRSVDRRGAEVLIALINEVRRAYGMTVIMASHQLSEAEQICERICVVQKGRIVAHSRLADIKSQHGTLERFFDEHSRRSNAHRHG